MNQQGLTFPLSLPYQVLLAALSFFLVAFGQPAWISWTAPLAAAAGYALFWRILLAYPSRAQRFWLAGAWFCGVQLVQLSWFASHPYGYIYGVYFFLAFWFGLQFAIIGIFITPFCLKKLKHLLAIAGLWTIFSGPVFLCYQESLGILPA